MSFARFVLVLCGLPGIAVGLSFLASPEHAGDLVGLVIPSRTADNSVRALFGGLQIGCGGILILSATRRRWIDLGLAGVVLVYGGMVLGRIISCVALGLPSRYVMFLLVGESVAAALGVAALVRLRRGHAGAAA